MGMYRVLHNDRPPTHRPNHTGGGPPVGGWGRAKIKHFLKSSFFLENERKNDGNSLVLSPKLCVFHPFGEIGGEMGQIVRKRPKNGPNWPETALKRQKMV